jgi:hypothetical protein
VFARVGTNRIGAPRRFSAPRRNALIALRPCYASRQLVHTLMEHDLVDEVRLMVFVLGTGERLFGENHRQEVHGAHSYSARR